MTGFLRKFMENSIFRDFKESVANVHFPRLGINIDDLNDMKTKWHRRVAFDKLFFFKYGAQRDRIGGDIDKNRTVKVPSDLSLSCEKNMAFELTSAQKRVLEEIRRGREKIFTDEPSHAGRCGKRKNRCNDASRA